MHVLLADAKLQTEVVDGMTAAIDGSDPVPRRTADENRLLHDLFVMQLAELGKIYTALPALAGNIFTGVYLRSFVSDYLIVLSDVWVLHMYFKHNPDCVELLSDGRFDKALAEFETQTKAVGKYLSVGLKSTFATTRAALSEPYRSDIPWWMKADGLEEIRKHVRVDEWEIAN